MHHVLGLSGIANDRVKKAKEILLAHCWIGGRLSSVPSLRLQTQNESNGITLALPPRQTNVAIIESVRLSESEAASHPGSPTY